MKKTITTNKGFQVLENFHTIYGAGGYGLGLVKGDIFTLEHHGKYTYFECVRLMDCNCCHQIETVCIIDEFNDGHSEVQTTEITLLLSLENLGIIKFIEINSK